MPSEVQENLLQIVMNVKVMGLIGFMKYAWPPLANDACIVVIGSLAYKSKSVHQIVL